MDGMGWGWGWGMGLGVWVGGWTLVVCLCGPCLSGSVAGVGLLVGLWVGRPRGWPMG